MFKYCKIFFSLTSLAIDIFCRQEAGRALLSADAAGSNFANLKQRAQQYLKRAEALRQKSKNCSIIFRTLKFRILNALDIFRGFSDQFCQTSANPG